MYCLKIILFRITEQGVQIYVLEECNRKISNNFMAFANRSKTDKSISIDLLNINNSNILKNYPRRIIPNKIIIATFHWIENNDIVDEKKKKSRGNSCIYINASAMLLV